MHVCMDGWMDLTIRNLKSYFEYNTILNVLNEVTFSHKTVCNLLFVLSGSFFSSLSFSFKCYYCCNNFRNFKTFSTKSPKK